MPPAGARPRASRDEPSATFLNQLDPWLFPQHRRARLGLPIPTTTSCCCNASACTFKGTRIRCPDPVVGIMQMTYAFVDNGSFLPVPFAGVGQLELGKLSYCCGIEGGKFCHGRVQSRKLVWYASDDT
jgi:hypothetical protein